LFVLQQALGVNILKKLLLCQHVTYAPCMPRRKCTFALCFVALGDFLCFLSLYFVFSRRFCHRQVTGCSQRQQMRDKWVAEDSSLSRNCNVLATAQRKCNYLRSWADDGDNNFLPLNPQPLTPFPPILLLSRQQQFIWVWKRWINFTALCSTIKNYLLSAPASFRFAFGPNVRTGPELNCCKVVVA